MNEIASIWLRIFITFIISYLVIPIISGRNITNNLNKIYHATLMALLRGIAQITMDGYKEHYQLLLFLIILSMMTFYFIRKQIFIGDRQYLLETIENHQMELDMAKSIKGKTTDPEVMHLADTIIKNQQEQIIMMRSKLNKTTQEALLEILQELPKNEIKRKHNNISEESPNEEIVKTAYQTVSRQIVHRIADSLLE